ncbi:MAG TPA: hypothetical protein VF104_03230 [Burkholderiales bacterium]
MAKLRSPSGDLAAQRNADNEKFFDRKIKGAGDIPGPVFMPMNSPRLAQTDAQIGSLPKGSNTTGGVVGGLNDKGSYQGIKAGGKR